jgi:hypothetical protein
LFFFVSESNRFKTNKIKTLCSDVSKALSIKPQRVERWSLKGGGHEAIDKKLEATRMGNFSEKISNKPCLSGCLQNRRGALLGKIK